MINHTAHLELLVRDRVDDLRRTADAAAWSRTRAPHAALVGAARRGTGWLLVDVGFRLVASGRIERPAHRSLGRSA
jgi:hypothetical protein